MAWTTTKRTPTASMPELEKPDRASLVVMTPAFHTTHMAMKAIVSGVLAPFTRKENITTKTDSTNHGCQLESFMLEGVQWWCSPGGRYLDPITKPCRYNQNMQSAGKTNNKIAWSSSITLATLVMCLPLCSSRGPAAHLESSSSLSRWSDTRLGLAC